MDSFKKCACIIVMFLLKNSICTPQSELLISKWADKLGKELWNLGKIMTKHEEIKYQYSIHNAQVEEKDPKKLLSEIVDDISHMMDRKMDAINCILNAAEAASEAYEHNSSDTFYTYYSSRYSSSGDDLEELPGGVKENKDMYLNMTLNNDTHFYNLPVDTNHSSVHVPTNVFDRHSEAESVIRWSEILDDVFKQNYQSDPALSWQYFGSTSGIMRHYPGMKWTMEGEFDCRVRTWFIEAATCTKDVIILLDNSGSMTGLNKHIALLTAKSILDTLSNNDYVNVLNYSKVVDFMIPCFKDVLVQATPENRATFIKELDNLKPTAQSNLKQALKKSFELLRTYREKRGCDEDKTDCNQALMLITDGTQVNMSDLILSYNLLYNGSNIPVRLFPFLIGNDVINPEAIVWMACHNKGFFSHVRTLEDVTRSVYNYIPVIARPLVLQGIERPVSWTHAYQDITYEENNQNLRSKPYRLLTSVAVPAFDKKVNKNNKTRVADLLGVAATDVPIEDFAKLTFPYKIGVNAYAFIVSNNGYVLMHPDLRPVVSILIYR